MIVLDTDHISFLQRPKSREGRTLLERLNAANDEAVVSIISAEEQMRSWISLIHRYRDVRQQTLYYLRLSEFLQSYAKWRTLDFDSMVADRFQELRQQGVNIGASDLKIASITLIHEALLLTRNFADFSRVPNLRFADWSQPLDGGA